MARTIVVTGSASGIGAATAALLRERGETVIGVDLHEADVPADLSTREGRAAAVESVTSACGGVLDGLVTCAGLSGAGAPEVSVNYFGTTELVTGLQPALAAGPAPRVALVGSIASTQPHDHAIVEACLGADEPTALAAADTAVSGGRPHEIYTSTKNALARWMRRTCVTPDFAGAGIPVNAIAPGVVLTPMTAELIADPQWQQVMDQAVPMPLHGYAEPIVVARALSWLLAAENSHMTGQQIFVDGGADAVTRGDDRF